MLYSWAALALCVFPNSHCAVVLLVVFLAMSVDKLTEVRSADEKSAEEDEKKEKKRQMKQQHITDLQNNDFHANRRTILKAMRFNSAENNAEMVQRYKRSLKLSLPGKDLSSSSSSTPAVSRETSRSPSGSPIKKKASVKLRNPLRLMKQRSGFFDEQNLRRINLEIDSESTGTTVLPSRQSSVEKPHKKVLKKLSLDSVPKYDDQPFSPTSYARTQSSPADSPSIPNGMYMYVCRATFCLC